MFTFKIRNINDNYLLHFNFFLNCYDIHLLLIMLVDAFPWHLGFFCGCAILKKPMDNFFCSFFSSSIASSFKYTSLKKHTNLLTKINPKKKELKFPQQWWQSMANYHHCQGASSFPKHKQLLKNHQNAMTIYLF